ncbi:cadmium-translocating P-type ATPase [bacterium]|nr:cadmium-translocating P-type ATPase [bacterium]MBU1614392.1 cadmium-translocating P-type ATPase [bacterium]
MSTQHNCCQAEQKQAKSSQNFIGKTKVVLPVNEMHCADCALNIEGFLKHISGVLEAEVNYITGNATIFYDPHRVDLETIKKAIAKPGYIVRDTALEKARNFWQRKKQVIFTTTCGILLLSSWIATWSSFAPAYLNSLFALLAVLIGGYPIFKNAAKTLLSKDLNVNVLVSLAVVGAVTIGGYKEAATVIFIMLLGELLEDFTVGKTRQAIAKLIGLVPKYALIKRNSETIQVAVDEVQVGDIVVIKPGERIPVDGVVISGEGWINQAMLTGEPIPVEKHVNDKVYSGTVNDTGSFEMQAGQVGENTTLARIRRLVQEAEEEKAPIQRVVDKYSRYFVPLILLTAVIVYLVTRDITRAITILIVACPCALILATPTAVVAAIGHAARRGILIKGGEFLESAGRLNLLLMDKTGTLTVGQPRVTEIKGFGKHNEQEILRLAAIVEKRSEHPLAKAVVRRAEEVGMTIPDPEDFKVFRGKGVIGDQDGRKIILGSREFIGQEKIDLSEEIDIFMQEREKEGETALIVAHDQEVCGVICVADTIRKEASIAISELKNSGIKDIFMLTGDNQRTAESIAKKVGISEFFFEMLPEDKLAKVKELKEKGYRVGMIGDGINDAPALACADIGIAVGGGTDVAMETSDIVLMSDDLRKIPATMRLSRKALKIINGNLIFGLLFNLGMVTLSAKGNMSMIMGAVMHQASSLIVVLNSMRLLVGREK